MKMIALYIVVLISNSVTLFILSSVSFMKIEAVGFSKTSLSMYETTQLHRMTSQEIIISFFCLTDDCVLIGEKIFRECVQLTLKPALNCCFLKYSEKYLCKVEHYFTSIYI